MLPAALLAADTLKIQFEAGWLVGVRVLATKESIFNNESNNLNYDLKYNQYQPPTMEKRYATRYSRQ